MATLLRLPPGKFQVHDTTEVGDGWKLYTYEVNTSFTTPKATYQDSAGSTAHSNPIVFDSRGEADIWWDGQYDIKLEDDLGNTIWTMEDVGQGAIEDEQRTAPQAVTYNLSSDADYTLTAAQELYGRVIITDTLSVLTAARNIFVSTTERGYYFQNDTAQALTLKTSAGSGIAVPAGHRGLYFCDGTNVVRAFVDSELDSTTITPASDADVTLSDDQAAFPRLILADGSWTATHNIIVPAEKRSFFIDNSSGTYDATVKTSAGTGIIVSAGLRRLVQCDGTNVIDPITNNTPGIQTQGALCPHDNLIIVNNTTNPTYQMDIDADALILSDANGAQVKVETVNLTVDLTVSGANGLDTGAEAVSTEYHMWVAYNGTTAIGLFSTSSSAPTLPAGYSYYGYVGSNYNDSGGDFLSIYQRDLKASVETTGVLTNGVATSYTSVDLSAVLPSTARTVDLDANVDNSSAVTDYVFTLYISPENGTVGECQCHGNVSKTGSSLTRGGGQIHDLLLKTAQTAYYKINNADLQVDLRVSGWRF